MWISVDPLAEKYPNVSSYVYCLDNPVKFIDPDGKDVIIMVWGTGDGRRGPGHSAIAIQNYKTVDGKRVFDGTYTVRDLWPGVEANKSNFYKDLPAAYSPTTKGNVYTLEQLKKDDITLGSEGRPADGLINIKTTPSQDNAIIWNLNMDEKGKGKYNGVKHNCSDYVESALEFLYGAKLSTTEEKAGESTYVTTPNQIYKAAKSLPGSQVLKDAGSETQGSSLDAATGGKTKFAAKKVESR